MSSFASQPPSKKPVPVGNFFRGGMMPASPRDVAGLIVFDLRNLNLPISEGKEIELALRDFLFEELAKRRSLENMSAVDLTNAVFGIAIE